MTNHTSIFFLLKIQEFCMGQDNYTDENRPYKFGFHIEGYQHRMEEKDENGIIMGEFGFVTGDGVYHITVYATDENGNFKILKMKNIYIGLPDDGSTTTPAPVTTKPNEYTYSTPNGKPGCSGCFIPTSTTSPHPVQNTPLKLINTLHSTDKPTVSPIIQMLGETPYHTVNTKAPINKFPDKITTSKPPGSNNFLNSDIQQNPSTFPHQNFNDITDQNKPNDITQKFEEGNTNKIKEDNKYEIPHNQVNIVELNKNNFTDFMKENMTFDDLMAILYKFNYTLTFHGHHETGDVGGNKQGEYFVNGRDGISRHVSYVANEFGYQPNITFINLAENSKSIPNVETEKELNELKGYEFKWFYQR